MFSAWNLLYLVPLLFMTYWSFKKNIRDYKVITSTFWCAFGLTWFASFVLKSEITGFVESDNYRFALAIDLIAVSIMLRLVGLKLIMAPIMLGYAAMIYFSYMPYSEGNINLRQYYIILEIIGVIQILFIAWGMFYDQIISGIDYLLRGISRNRLNVPRSFCGYELYASDSPICDRNHNRADNLGKLGQDSELCTDVVRIGKEVKTPTYGTGATNYWKAVK